MLFVLHLGCGQAAPRKIARPPPACAPHRAPTRCTYLSVQHEGSPQGPASGRGLCVTHSRTRPHRPVARPARDIPARTRDNPLWHLPHLSELLRSGRWCQIIQVRVPGLSRIGVNPQRFEEHPWLPFKIYPAICVGYQPPRVSVPWTTSCPGTLLYLWAGLYAYPPLI
jgi:hypothetical protein